MRFAERLGARFAAYKALEGEELELCPPGSISLEALEQTTQGLDGGPPGHGTAGGAQDPLPGLETPPCR